MAKKPTEEVIGKFEVEDISKIKSGNGKHGKWTLWEIEYDDGETARGFDKVKEGDTVEVFETTTYDDDGDPEYTNTNYRSLDKKKKAKKSSDDDDDKPAKKEKGSLGGDKRVLKLLVVMASQMGVDEEEINAILEEK